MLPSRSFSSFPEFNNQGLSELNNTGIRVNQDGEYITVKKEFFTTDGGAGGAEILDWYNNNTGSFWVFLAYDNYNNFSSDEYNKLAQYNEVIEVMFADFSYSVEKRGASNYDFWNIDFSLEEV
jgi:hypothetical protein